MRAICLFIVLDYRHYKITITLSIKNIIPLKKCDFEMLLDCFETKDTTNCITLKNLT